ncbi:MAG TPA: YbaK/EbsC family protein [Egibacteraceae bacterium]|nr:YbaK/EbsC family protein [Egibacteraceae bacterium]
MSATATPDPAEQRVIDALVRLGIPHELVRIDPAFAATADFCREYGFPMEASVNCIVVMGKAEPPLFAACMVQATRRLDVNGAIKRRFGVRKASFAPSDVAVELTGMLPDGVTPVGLPDGLPVWVDAPVMELDRIIVGGGSRALKILLPAGDLLRLPGAEAVDGLSRAD